MAGKILIIEDDPNLLEAIKYNLSREGYQVVAAVDGVQALENARSERLDLIILDLMLPKLDGLEVCRILRREMTVPIIMLTAKTGEIDRVVGLEMGADDYMTKPFSMRELLARVRAALRRSEVGRLEPTREQQSLTIGDMVIDTGRHQVSVRGSQLTLTAKEYDLLVFLARNRGFVFSREQLLGKVWGYDYAGDTRTVDVHVRWLRQKIEADPARPRNLLTVRGAGYRLEG